MNFYRHAVVVKDPNDFVARLHEEMGLDIHETILKHFAYRETLPSINGFIRRVDHTMTGSWLLYPNT